MIIFWLIAAGLVVTCAVALLFVVPPLLQKKPPVVPNSMLATFLGGPVAAVMVGIAIPVLMVMLFFTRPDTSTTPPAQITSAQNNKTTPELAQVVEDMAARLEKNPDDGKGWSTLAQSYAVMGRYAEAVIAYEKAVKLLPDDVKLLVDYADVMAVANDRNLRGKPLEMLRKAIKLDPKNVKALALLGTAAYEDEDYVGAVQYWEKMVKLLPPEDPFAKQMSTGIAEARTRIASKKSPSLAVAQGAARTSPVGVQPTAAGAHISGLVTLSPTLASKASPADSVFLLAKEVSGTSMPIAVMRIQVKDLPLNFTLDDSMAMMPTMKLSNFQEVMIAAKISKSGNPMTQPGDLTGEVARVKVGTNGVQVVINKISP